MSHHVYRFSSKLFATAAFLGITKEVIDNLEKGLFISADVQAMGLLVTMVAPQKNRHNT
jgi:hypothetical protein